jgi:SAM-dependent methyltransferase
LIAAGSPTREAIKRTLPGLRPLVRMARNVRYQVRFAVEHKPDRHVLTDVIFPAFVQSPGARRILFVGCDWYTRNYDKRLPGIELWTVDVDPRKARFGGTRHIVGSLTDIEVHIGADSLDAVICNGVVGYGLDDPSDCDRAFRACFSCLRPGGVLIVGWNDDGFHNRFPLEGLSSIQAFVPHTFSPFPCARYPTFGRDHHTFDFYRRPSDEHAPPERAFV